jgi:hypothetical protein
MPASGFFRREAGQLLASAVKAHNFAGGIQNDDERTRGIKDGGQDVAFVVQCAFGLL